MAKKLKKYDVYKAYYRRYLKNILRQVRKWTGLPDSVYEPYFNDQLLFEGYSVMYEYKGEIITTGGALIGLDWAMRPTEFQSANPYIIPAQKRKIGKDCVVFYNFPNYRYIESFNEIVDFYSGRLADIAISIDTSIRNSRVCVIPIVDDEKEAIRTAETLNAMYEGDPMALAYKTGFSKDRDILFPIKARDNIVVAELADAYNTVMDDFYQRIGIRNVAVDKAERTNLMEMSSNDQKLFLAERTLIEPMERACEQAKEIFGLDIKCELNVPEEPEMDAMYQGGAIQFSKADGEAQAEREGVNESR